MLPVRYVTDPLGARIGWSQAEGDSSNAKVVPLIVGGRTMLPMRFVAENLGCTVEWNAGAITVVGP